MHAPVSTIVTVLDNALGGTDPSKASSMSLAEIDTLAEFVVEYYDSWSMPFDNSLLTAYSGESLGMTQDGEPSTDYLFGSLLYYPRIVIHCPFGEWFTRDRSRVAITMGPRLTGDMVWPDIGDLVPGNDFFSRPRDLDEFREAVKNKLAIVHQLRDLIELGIVVPVPQWQVVRRRQNAIAAAMRHDVRDDDFYELTQFREDVSTYPSIGELMQGAVAPWRGIKTQHARLLAIEAPSFYLNKVISVADAFNAIYVPRVEPDYALFSHRIDRVAEELRIKSKLDYRIVHEMASIGLPLFHNVTPKNLIAARKNEAAFEDFRLMLSEVFWTASAPPDDPSFPSQISDYVVDHLGARVRQVEAATDRSAVLHAGARAGGAQLVLGAASVLGATLAGATAAPLLASGGSVAMIDAIRRMVFRPQPKGANLVISALLRVN